MTTEDHRQVIRATAADDNQWVLNVYWRITNTAELEKLLKYLSVWREILPPPPPTGEGPYTFIGREWVRLSDPAPPPALPPGKQ